MTNNYRLSKKIQNKLFNGIVLPTAIQQGYDMADQDKVVNMMYAMCKKYHMLDASERKQLILMAEKNIAVKIASMGSKDEETNTDDNEGDS